MSHSTFPDPIPDHPEGASVVAEAVRTRLTLLRIADRFYGIPLASISEVVVPRRIVRMPGAALPVLGLMNVKGRVVSIVELSHALGSEADQGGDPRVIVLDHAGAPVGLLVPEVAGIVDAEITPPGEPDGASELVEGHFDAEGRSGRLLNLDRVLGRYFR